MINTVIIGAGPYGLSIAAHFRRHNIPFRIFGRPMDSWLAHMPKGMMLKSDGFASDIYDPESKFTLRHYCDERGIEYADTGIPVRLDTFTGYGLAFKERMVPELENRMVAGLDLAPGGFRVRLDDGEVFTARRVVLAVGITHFAYTPPELSHLSPEFLSHSFIHREVAPWKGRSVVVLGGGASALDLAGLLREAGADVQLIARQPSLKFHNGPGKGERSLWKRMRHPQSGLGPGMRSYFFAEGAAAFHYLPESLRLHFVRTTLGPSGGWFIRDKVMGQLPLWLGQELQSAEVKNRMVHLRIRGTDGKQNEIVTEHVIAATGYRVNLERLAFVSDDIRSNIKSVQGTPVLSTGFESTVPGLYFAGVSAANSFGPVMRFAFGAGFTARTLTRAVMKASSNDPITVPVMGAARSTDETPALEEEPARS